MRIKQGRRAPYTQLGDWVMLAPTDVVRHAAKVLYWALSAHLTVKQDDDTEPELRVNPTLEMLAAMLGFSRKDKLLPYIDDLEALGAIEVDSELVPGEGNRRRNTYTIHQSPPPEYDHYESLGEFYRAFRKAKAVERAARKAARAAGTEPVPGSRNGVPGPGSPNEVPGSGSPNGDPDREQDEGTRRRNKIGGRAAAPRTPAVLPAGHVDEVVAMGGDQQGDQQTARAGVRADVSNPPPAQHDPGTDDTTPVGASAEPAYRSPRRAPVRGSTRRTAPATSARR